MPHVVDLISGCIGLILQCATLITVIYAFIKFTQKPTESLDSRVTALEKWQVDTEKRLHEGTVHFSANDESNRVTQNALVAIMDALGSSEVIPQDARAEIKKRKTELMEYLTDR